MMTYSKCTIKCLLPLNNFYLKLVLFWYWKLRFDFLHFLVYSPYFPKLFPFTYKTQQPHSGYILVLSYSSQQSYCIVLLWRQSGVSWNFFVWTWQGRWGWDLSFRRTSAVWNETEKSFPQVAVAACSLRRNFHPEFNLLSQSVNGHPRVYSNMYSL